MIDLPTDPEPVSPADRRKPDPAEPWRFVCPTCGRQVFGAKETRNFDCRVCQKRYSKDELRDLKS